MKLSSKARDTGASIGDSPQYTAHFLRRNRSGAYCSLGSASGRALSSSSRLRTALTRPSLHSPRLLECSALRSPWLPAPAFSPFFNTSPPSETRIPKRLNVTARWGRRRAPETDSNSDQFPGPPDARNLGKLSKVLPFSVYELQWLEFVRDLKEGDYGADVEALQRAMHTFGHMPKDSQITGYFGKATFVAVREWQRAQGLPGTGYWGPMSQETFADVVQRHAAAQEALVTRAPPTHGLVRRVGQTVTAVVPVKLPQSPVGRAGVVLGLALVLAGAVATVLRLRAGLREADEGLEEKLEGAYVGASQGFERNGLSYQGRWGRPEAEAGYFVNRGVDLVKGAESEANGQEERRADGGESSGGLLEKVGRSLYASFARFERLWSEGWEDERPESSELEDQRLGSEAASVSGRLESDGRAGEPNRYNSVLETRRKDEEVSYEEEIAQLQASIEALVKELSAVEVQRQAALKALEEERQRNAHLEVRLEHKDQVIAALQAEIKTLKGSQRTQLTASHRD
ncbi:hypothetical protein KFL_001160210 [Klebsormidium nitens]|uniref:Peptidoglycan binding-like domain-containing protein n=1 Tax=Klebsormidium nitens TaxID=105231 RepID=A0A1Y1I1E0_KLENI|nr:hypothetical protein KFL_001160210 [Klebsormidium nitens]|eukprot:GAQ82587.1 hypothetical protein KFL_001160210 [Klebsormidium nitens]